MAITLRFIRLLLWHPIRAIVCSFIHLHSVHMWVKGLTDIWLVLSAPICASQSVQKIRKVKEE